MLRVLDDLEVEEIHNATLEVMDRIGVVIKHEEALRRLEDIGVRIDWSKQLAKFPPYVVEEFVRKAPPYFTQGARSQKFDIIVKNGKTYTRSLSGCSHILDIDTGRCRVATKKDSADGTRLLDALENIKYCGGWIYPGDEPPSSRDVCLMEIMLENTEKHICIQAYEASHLRYMNEMAKLVMGGEEELRRRPILSVILAPTSPLILSGVMVEQIVECGKYGLPALMCSTPICGAASPITLAGQLVVVHAENLAGTVISQALYPGTPVVYGPRPNTMDMKTGNALWGSVEFGIASAATVQMGHYCGLPVDTYSLGTDSKALDEQTAVEKAATLLPPALAGANLLVGAGFIETIRTASFEQIVIDNEHLGMMYRILRGVRVDEEALAIDLLAKVGPGGNFLAEKHTRKHAREEHYIPRILNRDVRERWEESGSRDLVTVAREEARRILREHEPPTLDKDLQKDLRFILDEARKELSKG